MISLRDIKNKAYHVSSAVYPFSMHRVGVEKPSEENIIPKKTKEGDEQEQEKRRKKKEWGKAAYPDKREERPWRPRAETALGAGPCDWRGDERGSDPERSRRRAQHAGRGATSCTRLQNKTPDG